ncbi:uncharacterized protein LOC121901430 [Scomber scombrus]|uniref:Uncharacterized protein LOC121901430 n=1 Tax=Scomber scombrus TaxID=13677 RepID=A0AAV1NDJ0_SCOSC
MIVLLLLSACLCLGLTYDDVVVKRRYGTTYKWVLSIDVHSIEFSPKDKSNVRVVWKKGDAVSESKDYEEMIVGVIHGFKYFYQLTSLTQKDSGRYSVRNKERRVLRTTILEVIENKESYELKPGDNLHIGFNLKPDSCNIYFLPERDLKLQTEIVRQGRRQDGVHCVGFQLKKPCGIYVESLEMSCRGKYEVRDENDNLALVVTLEIEELPPRIGSRLGITIIFFSVVFFCSCVKACCCGDTSSKEGNSETEDAAESPPEDDHQPVRPRSDESSHRSGTQSPAQLPYTPTRPPVHKSTDIVPPPYSEIVAPAGPSAPTLPSYSDIEPQQTQLPVKAFILMDAGRPVG